MESHTSFILSLWLTMLNTFKNISWPSEFLLLRTLFIKPFVFFLQLHLRLGDRKTLTE